MLNLAEEDDAVVEALTDWIVTSKLSNSTVEDLYYFARNYEVWNLIVSVS